MSVRAYKINKIAYDPNERFNLWYNMFIVDNIVNVDTLDEGGGITEVNGSIVKEVLEDIDILWDTARYPDENKEDTINILKEILKDCDNNGGYCSYYCF